MALSFSTHTYAGGVRTFPISFALGSGDRANVAVYVIGELDGAGDQLYRDFTWNSDSEILVADAITIGAQVRIQRTVSKTTLIADYTQPGSATRENLQATATQAMMAIHEFIDGRVDSLPSDHPSFIALAAAEAAAADAVASAAATAIDAASAADSASVAASAQADAVPAAASALASAASATQSASDALASKTAAGVSATSAEAAETMALAYKNSAYASEALATTAQSVSQNAAAAAESAAASAELNLLALGEALSNVLGAFSVDTNGDLQVAYNSTVITNISVDAGTGELSLTYEV